MRESEEEKYERLKLFDQKFYSQGIDLLAGIDEAGRGPLAGPVVVSCVIMPKDIKILGINDSKKLSQKKRENLYEQIIKEAVSVGVGIVEQKRIDEINILNATKEALTEAILKLTVKPERILVDALNHINTLGIPYNSIIKGDATSYSIATASIIAKVTRDRIMEEWDKIYPGYGFSKHKGYGTAEHIQKIKELGPCILHRKSFIKNFI